MAQALEITDAEFWRLPLAERMAQFAVWREEGPFHRAEQRTLFMGRRAWTSSLPSPATPRCWRSSRRPLDFGSGGLDRHRPQAAGPGHGVLRLVHRDGRPPPRPPTGDRGPVVPPRHPEGARLGGDDLHGGDRRLLRGRRARPGAGAVAAVPAADHLRHDGHPRQRVPHGARRHQRDPRRRRPRHAGRPGAAQAMFNAAWRSPTS